MLKCKCIMRSTVDDGPVIEDLINEWFSKNPYIKLEHTDLKYIGSQDGGVFIVFIFYSETKMSNYLKGDN